MKCPKCHADILDDSVFCSVCGQKIRESADKESSKNLIIDNYTESPEENTTAVVLENSTSDTLESVVSAENTSADTKFIMNFSKKHTRLVASIGILVVGVIIVLTLLIPRLGINPFKVSIKEQSYDSAFSLYADMSSDNRQKANSWLTEYVESVEQQYYSDKMDYVSASAIITELECFDSIQDLCVELSHDIFLDNQSSQLYNQARLYAEAGKWIDAYQALNKIHTEYRFFEDVSALKEDYAVNCRSEVIEQMNTYAATEEFSKLQNAKETALSILPDDVAIIQAYEQHCDQFIQKVLEKANSFAIEQNFVDAIKVLENALMLLESDKITETISQYTTTYANDIIADIPNSLISFTVDGIPIDLSIESLEIIKRQTNEKDDNIYCTVIMSNTDYRLSMDCYFLYNYYDVGGWILDYYEIQNQPILIPLTGISTETAHSYLSQYYEILGANSATFSADTGVSYFNFSIKEDHTYCSFSGNIDVFYSFSYQVDFEESSCNISARWIPEVGDLGSITYDWNVEGSWYAAIYRTSGHNVGKFTGYELYLDITQLSGNSITVEAVSPYDGSEYNSSNNRMEYIGNADVTYDYSTHGDPTLTFNFTIRKDGSAYYTIIINKDSAIVHKDGIKNNEIEKL